MFRRVGANRRCIRSHERGGSGALWVPTDDADGEHWWRGDMGITPGTGSDVAGWEDEIAAVDIVQASGPLRPNTATRDGQTALEWDKGDRLQGSFASVVGPAMTLLMVVEQRTNGGSNQYMFDGDGASDRVLVQENGSAFFMLAGGTVQNTGVAPSTSPMLLAVVADGASSALYRDDMVTAAWTGNPGSNGLGGLTLGSSYTGTHYLDGWIWEVFITSSSNAATRTNFRTYAQARYPGLP